MQHDEVVWQIINQGFCSFKTKIARERTFCQNPFNVTGLCLRSACPLANSSYATIREEEGICYLYIKTIERAHSPKNLWEKIQLPANYIKSLEIVDKHLEHFPKYLLHRNKQRLTKIHQMLIRMRRLKLKARPKIVTINTKVEQREKGRERKALKAAELERAIEKELLDRLSAATDQETIYNYAESQFNKIVHQQSAKYREENGEEEEDPDAEEEDPEEEDGEEEEGEEEDEEQEEEREEEDEEDEGEYNVQYVEDFEESDEEDEEDMEDSASFPSRFSAASLMSFYSKSQNSRTRAGTKRPLEDDDSAGSGGAEQGKRPRTDSSAGKTSKNGKKAGKKGKGTRVEIEYEMEEEGQNRERVREADTSGMDFNF